MSEFQCDRGLTVGGPKGQRLNREFTQASVNFSSIRPVTGGWDGLVVEGLSRNYIQRYHIACDEEALAAGLPGSRTVKL